MAASDRRRRAALARRRGSLDADRIVDAAARVADRQGLAGVTMRAVAAELGVEAMSLYHHVAGKEALLDALADWVFRRIELPVAGTPWRPAMAARAASARAALAAHPWALGFVESRRSRGPALFAHHEAVLACLRADGFDVALAVHAFSAIDSYVYGFVLTEANLPIGSGDADAGAADGAGAEAAKPSAEEFVDGIRDLLPAERYPHLVEMIEELVVGKRFTYGDEFAFGLDLVLDGIERHRASTPAPRRSRAAPTQRSPGGRRRGG